MNVLFTNIGRRTYFIEFALELKKQGYPLNIFVNDVSKNTPGFWVSDKVKYFLTPRVLDDKSKYTNILIEHCIKYGIDIIIPMMDYEIPVLASKKEFFKSYGVEVIISDYETVMNCLDKKRNYDFCLKNNISVPKVTFTSNNHSLDFPLIMKRRLGSGSVGLKVIRSEKELVLFEEDKDLLQQFIEGKEYGMDILNDLNGNLAHAFVREKILMRNGETDKASGVYSDRFIDLAKDISCKFRHVGNMDIDFVEDNNGKIYFIDFNPRFGGGYPLTHISGYNYLKALLDMTTNRPVKFPETKNRLVFMKGISIHHYVET